MEQTLYPHILTVQYGHREHISLLACQPDNNDDIMVCGFPQQRSAVSLSNWSYIMCLYDRDRKWIIDFTGINAVTCYILGHYCICDSYRPNVYWELLCWWHLRDQGLVLLFIEVIVAVTLMGQRFLLLRLVRYCHRQGGYDIWHWY